MSGIEPLAGDPVDRTHLPVDEWRLVESRPGADLGLLETLFALGNGYLGMRGTPSEGRARGCTRGRFGCRGTRRRRAVGWVRGVTVRRRQAVRR